MPKTEGDEVEYLYDPFYDPTEGFDDKDLGPWDLEDCGVLIALTTKSRYQVKMGMSPRIIRAIGVKQIAPEMAEDLDAIMNWPSNHPDDETPELGVEIDVEKIRAALETGMART